LTGTSHAPSLIRTARDVRLFRLGREIIAVSCDSCGGIGPKPLDRVRVSGYTVGRFTARVALMEALSVGAEPVCLANTLAVEPRPTGVQIIKGIRDEVKHAGLDSRIIMTYSMEKNIPVRQTGVGVTVLATAASKSLRVGRCKSGDAVVAVGMPHVGNEVLRAERNRMTADTRDVRSLLNSHLVNEVIPVGSQGILHEARTIAEDSSLEFTLRPRPDVDVRKSAGPATAILCACPDSRVKELSAFVEKPVHLVGALS
jgi:selenophosphate synthetase-related protein